MFFDPVNLLNTYLSIACGGNACGVKPICSDSKVTNFATLILRKVKEIGLNPTTRFEYIELSCGLGWFKKFKILNRSLAEETPAE